MYVCMNARRAIFVRMILLFTNYWFGLRRVCVCGGSGGRRACVADNGGGKKAAPSMDNALFLTHAHNYM